MPRKYPSNGRNDTDEDLLRRASDGDEAALATLFGRYRKRLRQMIRLRLDRRLQGRVDMDLGPIDPPSRPDAVHMIRKMDWLPVLFSGKPAPMPPTGLTVA